jgi:pyruvate dehydrogenase E2 component (dihydrolipoamide acetyltransferase)
MAREGNIDLSKVTGSGPNGRIVRRDLEALPGPAGIVSPAPVVQAAPLADGAETTPGAGAAAYVEIPHSRMRQAIARRLSESKATVPHFYLTTECRVDRLLELRRQVNESAQGKVSVNDFVVKAVAAAFAKVPEANVTWTQSALRQYSRLDLSIAVAIDGGLVTPVLRDAGSRTLSSISGGIAELAARARAGRLRQDELEGGSFAVTNLGMFGVPEFSAILNPPQSGILAVGAARAQPVVEDGELAVGTVMRCTLSVDHRAIDGALAARWLAAVTASIENPLATLI